MVVLRSARWTLGLPGAQLPQQGGVGAAAPEAEHGQAEAQGAVEQAHRSRAELTRLAGEWRLRGVVRPGRHLLEYGEEGGRRAAAP